METKQIPLLILTGPTAIGKTEFSLRLAEEFDCEIVSVDSMQIYRYMDIGTAKASRKERKQVPHHLIDIIDPDESYDAAQFVKDCTIALHKIYQRKKIPLLTGGTGLYFTALIHGIFSELPSDRSVRKELKMRLELEGRKKLHEELAACDSITAKRIHQNDTHRLLRGLEIFQVSGIPWSEHLERQKIKGPEKRFDNILGICLTEERKIVYERINERSKVMLANGLEEEVTSLLEKGYSPDLKPFQSIGYKHILNYISGVWTQSDTIEILSRDTRRYAKRQITWFKKMEILQHIEKQKQDEIISLIHRWKREIGHH